MCRCDIQPQAETTLVALLNEMGNALCDQAGVPREWTCGPVDFGADPEETT